MRAKSVVPAVKLQRSITTTAAPLLLLHQQHHIPPLLPTIAPPPKLKLAPKTIPWTDPGCPWPLVLICGIKRILCWLFLEINRGFQGAFFGRERKGKEAGRRRGEEEGGVACLSHFRLPVRRNERFGRPPDERVGPALRPAQSACSSSCRSTTAAFRPLAGRNFAFGRPRADSATLLQFLDRKSVV